MNPCPKFRYSDHHHKNVKIKITLNKPKTAMANVIFKSDPMDKKMLTTLQSIFAILQL